MPKAQKTVKRTTGKSTGKDPKASHLYTDDNPSTTLHGTGFKDPETAQRTIDLVSERSLTYQFQTINTMYYRASHHPHKNAAIEAAMTIFKGWLDETYPEAKNGLRAKGFKPVLAKEIVQKHLPTMSRELDNSELCFAEAYVQLTKGKRLANVLVDDEKPAGQDWERKRYEALDKLVDTDKETAKGWTHEELWTNDKLPSRTHLRLIAWGWTPASPKSLK